MEQWGICCVSDGAKSKVRAGRRQAGGRQEWQEWQGTTRGGGGADYTVSVRRPGGGFGFIRQPRSLAAQQPEDPCNQDSAASQGSTARLGRDWGATGAHLRGRRHGGSRAAPPQPILRTKCATWPAIACSHQGDCSGGLAITAAPSCYRLLSAAISPSLACHATFALG
jgi:hypothetical protein